MCLPFKESHAILAYEELLLTKIGLMNTQTSEEKAMAINEAYHNLTVREAFAKIKGYPKELPGKCRTEFYFWLMGTATKDPAEQAEIQVVINQLKAVQKREFAALSPMLNPLSKQDLQAFTEELTNLGGGNEELGREYLTKYLEE